jgi:hypothetical protein
MADQGIVELSQQDARITRQANLRQQVRGQLRLAVQHIHVLFDEVPFDRIADQHPQSQQNGGRHGGEQQGQARGDRRAAPHVVSTSST